MFYNALLYNSRVRYEIDLPQSISSMKIMGKGKLGKGKAKYVS